MEAATQYRRGEAELLSALQELDEHKTYRYFECTSLFQYAVKHLRLSEDTALNFITVARKVREVPALKQEIERGLVTVSKARKISSVLTKENQDHWLGLAKSLSQKRLEREVAQVNPKATVTEKTAYVSGDRLKLEMGISESTLKMLKRAQDLEAQSRQKPVSLEETLQKVLERYLERHDPVRKAEKALERAAQPLVVARRPKQDCVREGRSGARRKARPAELVHQINLRDGGRCTHRDQDGVRCSNTRWIDVHHVLPRKYGGADTLENLVILCRAHHQIQHLRE